MSKESMMSAGAPAELMAAAEARGINWSQFFQVFTQAVTILEDTTKTTPQKVFAIITLVLQLIPVQPAK